MAPCRCGDASGLRDAPRAPLADAPSPGARAQAGFQLLSDLLGAWTKTGSTPASPVCPPDPLGRGPFFRLLRGERCPHWLCLCLILTATPSTRPGDPVPCLVLAPGLPAAPVTEGVRDIPSSSNVTPDPLPLPTHQTGNRYSSGKPCFKCQTGFSKSCRRCCRCGGVAALNTSEFTHLPA